MLAEFAQEKRVFMPIESVPDVVKDAFIAAEDQNFYEHEGVDIFAIVRAVLMNVKSLGTGRRPKGASTITQQVAKNFLLTNEVSYERKVKEAILAYRMEKAISKDRLLELYLNEIFLGSRAYGVAAAALQYFAKPLDELTIAEAAYLAALPKAPNNYHPVRNREAAIDRRNWVIGRMLDDGYIEEAQADLAKLAPLEVVERSKEETVKAPFFAEEVRRDLAQTYGEDSLYGGGLAVRTTIDPVLQQIAETAMRDGLQAYDRRHGYRGPVAHFASMDDWSKKISGIATPQGLLTEWKLAFVRETSANEAKLGFEDKSKGTLALKNAKWARKCLGECYALGPEITGVNQVVKPGDVIMVSAVKDKKDFYELQQVPLIEGGLIAMDPHTGRILAMQGGWSYRYGVSEFNRAVQAQRQPGSAFKPFVYLAALDKGFTPATLVLDAPFAIEDRPGHFWSPTNYSKEYYGPTPIRVGVEKSKNLMTVRLADFLGMDIISAYAARFGITEDMPPHLSMALGAGETTLLKITAAYAVLVNGGKKIEPTFVDRIQDRYGKTVYRHDERLCPDCADPTIARSQSPSIVNNRERVMNAVTAYQLTSMMTGVVSRGTARRSVNLGVPVAGKTGTTNDSKDVWFIGFTNNIVAGCYIGYDNPRSMGSGASGGGMCGPVFQRFMSSAVKKYGAGKFRAPKECEFIKIDRFTGARLSDSASGDHVVIECFREGQEIDFGIMFDGGFAMGENLPLVREESASKQVTTSTGKKAVVGPKAGFGTMSSGGLY